MRYFLKLADGDGFFEEVDKWTQEQQRFALSDSGDSPRYTQHDWVIVNDDNTISMQLVDAPGRDLAILVRAFQATMPERDPNGKGFIRTPTTIKFLKGKTFIMRELATGEEWRKKAA